MSNRQETKLSEILSIDPEGLQEGIRFLGCDSADLIFFLVVGRGSFAPRIIPRGRTLVCSCVSVFKHKTGI